jgi:2-oxoglutarate ferredoxin oxidoreductase subunit alpha
MSEEIRLMKGNEAIGEAAIRAGCIAYFGYPITPQNELTAYMARNMYPIGRTFIQAESEIAAINMVYGAASTGARAMTSSSSPGISLKQEGISYLCGADISSVIVNVMRAGPGLGGIAPSQGDYFQSTRGGGQGDYYTIVLAPFSVQEAADRQVADPRPRPRRRPHRADDGERPPSPADRSRIPARQALGRGKQRGRRKTL